MAKVFTPDELREARMSAGLSQRELGDLAGVSGNLINRAEAGGRPITPALTRTLLRAIASAPKLEPDELEQKRWMLQRYMERGQRGCPVPLKNRVAHNPPPAPVAPVVPRGTSTATVESAAYDVIEAVIGNEGMPEAARIEMAVFVAKKLLSPRSIMAFVSKLTGCCQTTLRGALSTPRPPLAPAI